MKAGSTQWNREHLLYCFAVNDKRDGTYVRGVRTAKVTVTEAMRPNDAFEFIEKSNITFNLFCHAAML